MQTAGKTRARWIDKGVKGETNTGKPRGSLCWCTIEAKHYKMKNPFPKSGRLEDQITRKDLVKKDNTCNKPVKVCKNFRNVTGDRAVCQQMQFTQLLLNIKRGNIMLNSEVHLINSLVNFQTRKWSVGYTKMISENVNLKPVVKRG